MRTPRYTEGLQPLLEVDPTQHATVSNVGTYLKNRQSHEPDARRASTLKEYAQLYLFAGDVLRSWSRHAGCWFME